MMLLDTLAVSAIKAVTAILAPLNGHTVCVLLNQPSFCLQTDTTCSAAN